MIGEVLPPTRLSCSRSPDPNPAISTLPPGCYLTLTMSTPIFTVLIDITRLHRTTLRIGNQAPSASPVPGVHPPKGQLLQPSSVRGIILTYCLIPNQDNLPAPVCHRAIFHIHFSTVFTTLSLTHSFTTFTFPLLSCFPPCFHCYRLAI